MPGPARLYLTNRTDTPYQVVYADPLRREQSGRAKRVIKWFAHEDAAKQYQDDINAKLLAEGSAGVHFDAVLRTDALAARHYLDAHGHAGTTLLALAQRHAALLASSQTAAAPIGPEVEAFLREREEVDGASPETVKNLKVRLWLWIDLARLATLGDISRDSVEVLRTRPVSPQTRRNDLAAASAFCTYLVDKRRLDHHPLKGLKRPRVAPARKPTWTATQCQAALAAAPGATRATLAVMLFSGVRPSELAETRLVYGRHPFVRVEGGKLKGRANRVIPMLPALRAYLRAAGDPAQVPPLSRAQREAIGRKTGVPWAPDVCRHTFISNRLQLARNDALVAREGGTSETIIFRHYHALQSAAEARQWAALRP